VELTLEAAAHDQVGTDSSDFVLGEIVALTVPLSPTELVRQAREEAGLGGPHGSGPRVVVGTFHGGVADAGRRRAVPQVGDPVDSLVVDGNRGRVDAGIGQVDRRCHHGDGHFFWLVDDVDVGRSVESGLVVNVVNCLQEFLNVSWIASMRRHGLKLHGIEDVHLRSVQGRHV
jgi:hypothetical protein